MIALLAGTAIIAWSGVLVRFLDVGPLAGAAWRMGLAVPALAVCAGTVGRRRTQAPDLRRAAAPLVLAGLAFAVDVGSFHIAINGARVANATFIGNVAPILAVIGGAILYEERPPSQPPFSALFAWGVLGETMTALPDDRRRNHSIRRVTLSPGYGDSHDPRSAERNSASMMRMFKTASSIGNSSGAFPVTARENASPCSVY